MKNQNPVSEAKRSVENARTLLREKADKQDGVYRDQKYVRMAGHTAYTGVLLALDSCFGAKTKGRKDVSWYKEQLAARDRKILSQFSIAYDLLHLSMSYDGIIDPKVSKLALERADKIINWVEQRTTTC